MIVELCKDTPRQIANIEHMLLFCGRMERVREDEPLFKEQRKFDSTVFTRKYILFRHRDKFELDPIKVKFEYDIRSDVARILTTDKGVGVLNTLAPIKKESVNEQDTVINKI